MNKTVLIEEIKDAFEGVLLKDGIGINEADRIMLEQRDVMIQKGRNLDRLWWRDWREIEDKYIASYSDVMYYMDSAGIKWVLPAFMIYSIKHYKEGSFSIDTTIYILEAGGLGIDKVDLYTNAQRRVIAKFLQFMVEVGDAYVDAESAKNALDKVWGEYL